MSLGIIIPRGNAKFFRAYLKYLDGTPAFLLGATVTGLFLQKDATGAAVEIACDIVDPATEEEDATGEITGTIPAEATAVEGYYRLEWKVDFATGPTPLTFPSFAPLAVVIRRSLG